MFYGSFDARHLANLSDFEMKLYLDPNFSVNGIFVALCPLLCVERHQ